MPDLRFKPDGGLAPVERPRHRRLFFWLGWLALTIAGQAMGVGILTGWRLVDQIVAPWLKAPPDAAPLMVARVVVVVVCAWLVYAILERAAAVLLPSQATYNVVFVLLSAATGLGIWITLGWTEGRGHAVGRDSPIGMGPRELVMLGCVATGALMGMAYSQRKSAHSPDDEMVDDGRE